MAFVGRAFVEDELSHRVVRIIEEGDEHILETGASPDRHPEELRRELIGLVQQRSAMTVCAQTRLEAVGRIRRHVLEEPAPSLFGRRDALRPPWRRATEGPDRKSRRGEEGWGLRGR